MEQRSREFGKHYLVEFTGCDRRRLATVDGLRAIFLEAVRISGATMLGNSFHQFHPEGVSAMVFIAESHFSIHTWPGEGYAACDIMTCGPMESRKAIDYLSDALAAAKTEVRVFSRGFDA